MDTIGRELNQFNRKDIECIVIDDHTPAGKETLDHLKQKYPWVKFFRNEKNLGPAHSRNLGTEQTSNDRVWFLDSDVYFEEHAISNMMALCKEQPDYCGILSGVGLKAVSNKSFQKYKNYVECSWQPKEGITYTVDSKSFLLIKNAFRKIGGFNISFNSPNVEDYDLCYRLLKINVPLFFTHRVKIYHHHPTFFKQFKLFYERAKNWMQSKSVYGYSSDDWATTKSEAALQLVNVGILGGLVLWVFFPFALIAIVMLLVCWMLLNRKVLSFLAHEDEPPIFFLQFFFYSCILALPVCAGAFVGLFRNFRKSS